jgi:hypothetical protein
VSIENDKKRKNKVIQMIYVVIFFFKVISDENYRPRSTGRLANASSSVASSNVPFRFLLQAKKTNDDASN